MVKFYSKYVPSESFATVNSGSSNIVSVADGNGRAAGAGRVVVAANEEVLVWNVKKGELLSRWKESGNRAQVTAIAQSAEDPDVFAVGYEDGTIRLWDLRTETVIISFNGHKSAVITLAFDKTGSKLASGAKDTNIIVWDLVAEVGLFRLMGHKDQVVALHWIYPEDAEADGEDGVPDSDAFILSASKDALVKLWDVSAQHCIETHLAQTNGECWAMGVSNDSTGFITAGIDGEMKVWSIDSAGLHKSRSSSNSHAENRYLHDRGTLQRASRDRAIGLHFHPKSDYFAVHGADKSVEIWRIRPEDEVQRMVSRKRKRRREKEATNGDANGDVAGDDTDAPIKPGVTDYFVSHMIVRTGGKVRAVDWIKSKSSKTLHLVTSLTNNQIELYDVPKQQGKASKQEEPLDYSKSVSIDTPGHRTDIRSLALSSDDRMLASASSGSLKIWNVRTGSCLRTLECGYALCCAFLPGDKIVVVGTKTGELELFDIASSTLIEKVNAHENAIWTIQVHPDGKSLVSGSADKSAKFWTFEIRYEEILGSKRKAARLHLINSRVLKVTDDILSMCFSPDARLLAVSTLDNTVKVFFVDSLKLFLNLYGHKLPVLNISISSDSKMIATCSADKNVRLWGLDFGDCHKAFFAHTDSIMSVSFIAQPPTVEETHYFFSASKDRTLRSWDGDKFEQIQRLDGHHGEIWAMVVSKAGEFVVTASHDKSIRIWNRTDEPIFLEEEREREMEELYESTLATSLGADADGADAEAAEAGAASKQTVATLTAGEKIVEALDLGLEDLHVVAQWKLRKQQNPDMKMAPPQRDPLFMALNNISAERHVLNTVNKIPAAQLHDALLILPFSILPSFFVFINIWIQRQWEVSLVCRVLFFLLKTHQRQIVASRELKVVIEGMRKELRRSLGEVRGVMGMNLAAVRCVEGAVREKGVRTLEDVIEMEAGGGALALGTGKKRGFVDVA